eukprot:142092-Chlamydomonas_euryale.AAC.2
MSCILYAKGKNNCHALSSESLGLGLAEAKAAVCESLGVDWVEWYGRLACRRDAHAAAAPWEHREEQVADARLSQQVINDGLADRGVDELWGRGRECVRRVSKEACVVEHHRRTLEGTHGCRSHSCACDACACMKSNRKVQALADRSASTAAAKPEGLQDVPPGRLTKQRSFGICKWRPSQTTSETYAPLATAQRTRSMWVTLIWGDSRYWGTLRAFYEGGL